MNKIILAIAVCCGIGGVSGHEALVPDDYADARSKWNWTLPEGGMTSDVRQDIDNALLQVGIDPSDEHVFALLQIVAQNQSYANYSHMVFGECFVDLSKEDEISSRKGSVSAVLSDASVFVSMRYPFTPRDLINEFKELTLAEE